MPPWPRRCAPRSTSAPVDDPQARQPRVFPHAHAMSTAGHAGCAHERCFDPPVAEQCVGTSGRDRGGRLAAGAGLARGGVRRAAAGGERSAGDRGTDAAGAGAAGMAAAAAGRHAAPALLAAGTLGIDGAAAASVADRPAGGGHLAGGALHRRIRGRGSATLSDGCGRQPAGAPRGYPSARAGAHGRCHRGHPGHFDHPAQHPRRSPAGGQPARLRRRGRAGDRTGGGC